MLVKNCVQLMVVFIGLYCSIVSSQENPVDISSASFNAAWASYKIKYALLINSSKFDEVTSKYNFAQTDAIIQKHNILNSSTYQMSHNQFSIMSTSQKQMYTGALFPPSPGIPSSIGSNDTINYAISSANSFPKSVDWRNDKCMQPVKNQAQCGSCWAFATVAAVEFGYCVAARDRPVSLSEQQLVDCSLSNIGCSGGWPDKALQYFGTNKGINTEDTYPYTATQNANCNYDVTQSAATISSYSPVNYIASNDVTTMMNIVANRGIVVVILSLIDSFFSYSGGVYTAETNCFVNNYWHALAIVGYGTTATGVDYWVARNSWGSWWGNAGYILYKRGVNQCDIETWAVSPNVLSAVYPD